VVGAPTGGSKGTGTVNVAAGYYVNGVNVTLGQQAASSSILNTVPPYAGNAMQGLGFQHAMVGGRVMAVLSGSIAMNTTGCQCPASLQWGTGTPPAQGAARTGTVIATLQGNSNASAQQLPTTLVGVINSAPGTTVWADVYLAPSTGQATFFSQNITWVEV
jgi:hypothetical protein